MTKKVLFTSGLIFGFASMSVAMGSVPSSGRVTDDTAIYQKLSEIRVPHQGGLNFDSDIARLSQLEPRYHEQLPAVDKSARLRGPMSRIATQKYQRPSKIVRQ